MFKNYLNFLNCEYCYVLSSNRIKTKALIKNESITMNAMKVLLLTISLIAHLDTYSCESRPMTDYIFIINDQNYQILKDSIEAFNLVVKTGPQGNYIYK